MNKGVLFYSLLAVPTSLAVFQIVAAVEQLSYIGAQQKTIEALDNVIRLFPQGLLKIIAKIVGISGDFALLVALTYGIDNLADFSFEYTKAFFSPGSTHLRFVSWQERNLVDWWKFLGEFRNEWTKETKERGLNETVKEFESVELDKWQCRVSRTLALASIIFVLAGVIDLFSNEFRRRGLIVLLTGTMACFTFYGTWVERENHYILLLVYANRSLRTPVPIPDSLKPLAP